MYHVYKKVVRCLATYILYLSRLELVRVYPFVLPPTEIQAQTDPAAQTLDITCDH